MVPPDKDWEKTFGGNDYDDSRAIQQTFDGGYIMTGITHSYGSGPRDLWLRVVLYFMIIIKKMLIM